MSTCDNVSLNDTMIDTHGRILDDYPGYINCAHWFNHVNALDKAEKELMKLADGIDIEELLAKCRQEPTKDNNNNDDDKWRLNCQLKIVLNLRQACSQLGQCL